MALTSDEIPTRFLPRMGLFLARFSTSAWIGAATLFVVVGVTEVTRGGFDSTTKDLLVTVRFPAFYVCGTGLVGVGWLYTTVAGFVGIEVPWIVTDSILSTPVLAVVCVRTMRRPALPDQLVPENVSCP